MVSLKSVEDQLKQIHFKLHSWGRAEVNELPAILLPDEEIFECVNGIYEGGFALLIATNFRVILIDKKPLNYLTVEDLRFDMINEIDYSHRLMGAQITISTGSKTMRFRSYNQPRLRKLIGHVQHCMAEAKKKQSDHQEGQNLHLEQINQQLQAYLIAQHQQQEQLRQQLERSSSDAGIVPPEPVKPSPELADFLYAQTLLQQYRDAGGSVTMPPAQPTPAVTVTAEHFSEPEVTDLYEAGRREIFGKQLQPSAPSMAQAQPQQQPAAAAAPIPLAQSPMNPFRGLEINPMRIAYSKLPMALRNRKFGRPSFHAHTQQPTPVVNPQPAAN